MSKKSKYTKKQQNLLWLFRILDFVVLFVPLGVYVIMALANEGVANFQKISITATVAIALILTLFNIIAQKRLRCPIWIILIGLYVAFREFLMPLIIMLAVGSILDDLVLTPLIHYYNTKYISAKTIDEKERFEE